MDKTQNFFRDCENRIRANAQNKELLAASELFAFETLKAMYSYNFSWMGRPVIQYPQDMVAMQEIIWEVKPDLIIETGIAHGGSLIMYASFLELIDNGHVLGIDIDIRDHNRSEIEKHSMFKRITMFEGSSISTEMAEKVTAFSKDYGKIMLVLDSNHTYKHVLKELELYSPLVTKNSYCVVFDTIIEDMPENSFPNRPWDKDNNPRIAVRNFLKNNGRFTVDKNIENKLLITVAPGGYLKCIKN